MQSVEERIGLTERTDEIHMLRKRTRRLGWLAVILVLALIGMGAWLIVDDGAADLTPAQEQMLVTIDAYLDAWNEGDGAAVAALMAPSGYHDNGTKYFVRDGQLASFVGTVNSLGFSVRRTDAAFVGEYVMTTDYIPADSTIEQPSIFRMSADGTMILWHMAP